MRKATRGRGDERRGASGHGKALGESPRRTYTHWQEVGLSTPWAAPPILLAILKWTVVGGVTACVSMCVGA